MFGKKKDKYKKITPKTGSKIPKAQVEEESTEEEEEPEEDQTDYIEELQNRIKLMEQEKKALESAPEPPEPPKLPEPPSNPGTESKEKYVEVPVILNEDNIKLLVYENNRLLKEILRLAKEE